MTRSVPPVFVGGSGRSGTTILARLLGQHEKYHTIPIEVRFIVDDHGLCDLITGKVKPERFVKLLTNRWWHRTVRNSLERGLHMILDEASFLSAVDRFKTSVSDAPVEAARHLLSDLFDPLSSAAGAAKWIEMTPPNVARGNALNQLMPDMKLLHIMRDGRDVACSVAAKNWGPNDHFEALEWWAERLIEAHQACDTLGDDNLLVVQLEDLIVRDREASLQRLLEFVGLDSTTSLIQFFDERMTVANSNIGRWRDEIGENDHERFSRLYAETLQKIDAMGAPYPT